mgnify:CR=1 FL=1
MTIMKKNNVYSASDFVGMTSSIVVEDSWWQIDSISTTKVGEYSNVPLFELQLKQLQAGSKLTVPEGFEDGSTMMTKNRTYFVREGRPMFNELAEVWEACEDIDALRGYVKANWSKKVFPGHVERLTGVTFERETKMKSIITSHKLEVWYPEGFEDGVIMDDFVFLCNKGVYKPILEKKNDPIADVIGKLDPKIIEAILAANK